MKPPWMPGLVSHAPHRHLHSVRLDCPRGKDTDERGVEDGLNQVHASRENDPLVRRDDDQSHEMGGRFEREVRSDEIHEELLISLLEPVQDEGG
jgi:hypothetical protein